VLEEVKLASARAAQNLGEIAVKPVAKRAKAKAGADARGCLDGTTNTAVAGCAEQYR
jgi:hypothetical protein